ncbi:conserved hypothetical protein [Perkinsus marinus ATCC 50983]|uniref:RRM domain-containing protein n=1 Tax=Perkinsus marinus (strain ATCC 50983 / TXsc) TaxID=423536 RepID=C5K673_PERM5|nr:conserved hypothetical protein [Perkinsus marinus ATCC 50983]EER20023.1 conserved hypothetical protein [Perkinsus marinus ATCC 50983]|eukprot:XP_002788227.1 conserved hypothetical protein [Perkinsus marinus ATCC 50983]
MEKVIDVKRAADGKKPYSSAGNAGPAPRRIDMLSHPTRAAGSGYNNIPSLEHRVDPSRLVDDPRKVFIGGIPVSGDKDKLIALLSRYGSVIDCDIMYDKETGRNKGYGRATYSTPAEANAAIRSGDANMIDAKCVEIKPLLRPPTNIPTTPNTNRFNNHDNATGYTMDGPCKVFLGGIPPSVDEDKLAHHLSRYGRVAEVRIYRDMETGRHKGFGFAIMGDPSQAKAACHGGNNNYIDSKWGTSPAGPGAYNYQGSMAMTAASAAAAAQQQQQLQQQAYNFMAAYQEAAAYNAAGRGQRTAPY